MGHQAYTHRWGPDRDQGPEKEEQAKTLASRIEKVLEGTGAKITTPKKTVDIRLHRIEESVTAEEVIAAIAKKGCCREEDISTGPMRMRTPWFVHSGEVPAGSGGKNSARRTCHGRMVGR